MLALLLCACYFIFYLWQRYRAAYKDAPKSVPIWECIKVLINGKDLWSKVLEVMCLVQERGGIACGYYYMRGLRRVYVVSNPEDSMTALKACAEKDVLYSFWEPWLGQAAFIGNIQTNKLHRKFFMKSLMPTNMDAFITYFNLHSERLVQKLSSHADKGPFDMVKTLRVYNLILLCDTMLAFSNMENVNFDAYLDAVSTYMKIVEIRFESLYLQHDAIFNYTKLKKKQLAALETLHQTRDEIILQRRKQLKDFQEKRSVPEAQHEVFLDTLMEAVDKGIITEAAMRAEVDGTIFAGHDTSAYTVLYALVLLGSYPQVQERAYKEIQQILGDRKQVTKDDLAKMVYIEAIIKESMRIYPYVVLLPRRVDEDIKLKSCTMKAGSTVAVFSWLVHRHECWGADAEQFRPERWLQPDMLPKPAVLLGFSEGARNCVGRRYAMVSMKTLLTHLIRHYRFRADHTKLKFEFMGVLEPISGHHVAVEKRI